MERVILLGGTDLFTGSPEHVLVDVAEAMKEEKYFSGQKLFSKGDPGDCMYVICKGKVKIHDGETQYAELSNRDFFGEFALLDAEDRSADATVVEDSLLLRLDQEVFYELMTDRVEFARGILRTLVGRLRRQNEKIRSMEG